MISKRTGRYRSRLEAKVARNLDEQKVRYCYEEGWLSYSLAKKYKPDFLLPNGIYIEVKGWFKAEDQRKHRVLREQHPDMDLRFVFGNIHSKVQGGRFTCQEWCEKYSFLYANKLIPTNWIKEKKC